MKQFGITRPAEGQVYLRVVHHKATRRRKAFYEFHLDGAPSILNQIKEAELSGLGDHAFIAQLQTNGSVAIAEEELYKVTHSAQGFSHKPRLEALCEFIKKHANIVPIGPAYAMEQLTKRIETMQQAISGSLDLSNYLWDLRTAWEKDTTGNQRYRKCENVQGTPHHGDYHFKPEKQADFYGKGVKAGELHLCIKKGKGDFLEFHLVGGKDELSRLAEAESQLSHGGEHLFIRELIAKKHIKVHKDKFGKRCGVDIDARYPYIQALNGFVALINSGAMPPVKFFIEPKIKPVFEAAIDAEQEILRALLDRDEQRKERGESLVSGGPAPHGRYGNSQIPKDMLDQTLIHYLAKAGNYEEKEGLSIGHATIYDAAKAQARYDKLHRSKHSVHQTHQEPSVSAFEIEGISFSVAKGTPKIKPVRASKTPCWKGVATRLATASKAIAHCVSSRPLRLPERADMEAFYKARGLEDAGNYDFVMNPMCLTLTPAAYQKLLLEKEGETEEERLKRLKLHNNLRKLRTWNPEKYREVFGHDEYVNWFYMPSWEEEEHKRVFGAEPHRLWLAQHRQEFDELSRTGSHQSWGGDSIASLESGIEMELDGGFPHAQSLTFTAPSVPRVVGQELVSSRSVQDMDTIGDPQLDAEIKPTPVSPRHKLRKGPDQELELVHSNPFDLTETDLRDRLDLELGEIRPEFERELENAILAAKQRREMEKARASNSPDEISLAVSAGTGRQDVTPAVKHKKKKPSLFSGISLPQAPNFKSWMPKKREWPTITWPLSLPKRSARSRGPLEQPLLSGEEREVKTKPSRFAGMSRPNFGQYLPTKETLGKFIPSRSTFDFLSRKKSVPVAQELQLVELPRTGSWQEEVELPSVPSLLAPKINVDTAPLAITPTPSVIPLVDEEVVPVSTPSLTPISSTPALALSGGVLTANFFERVLHHARSVTVKEGGTNGKLEETSAPLGNHTVSLWREKAAGTFPLFARGTRTKEYKFDYSADKQTQTVTGKIAKEDTQSVYTIGCTIATLLLAVGPEGEINDFTVPSAKRHYVNKAFEELAKHPEKFVEERAFDFTEHKQAFIKQVKREGRVMKAKLKAQSKAEGKPLVRVAI